MGEWRKVIPEGRDRLQSKVLVWVVGIPLIASLPVSILLLLHSSTFVKAAAASLTFGVLVWALRAATPMASLLGAVICFLVTIWTGAPNLSPIHSGLAPLGTLFVLTFAATRAGRRRKTQLGVTEGGRGRSAAQIVANLGMAGLMTLGGVVGIFDVVGGQGGLVEFSMHAMTVGLLAALCEATADTVSSEIGQAFGGRPVMLTTLRRVDTGTDGAVTLLGTFAGVAGAAIVAAVGMWSMQIAGRAAMVGFAGGVAGLFLDSVLGATVERKGWFGNDQVNFFSTVFAVAVSLMLAVVFSGQR